MESIISFYFFFASFGVISLGAMESITSFYFFFASFGVNS